MTARRPYTPRAFAPPVNDLFAQHERCALWAKMGMGKTVLAMTFLDLLHNVWGEDRPTLVLAPLRVARDTWSTEAGKWEHLRGLEVVPVVGDAKQRLAALRRDAPIYATNFDNIQWLVSQFEDSGKAWPFATVVADEASKLKSFRLRQGGVRAQALASVAHKNVTRWINLTGTPASNGLEDLWGQTWFLDAGARLGRTFTSFRDRWFRPVKAGEHHQWVAFPHAQAEIQALLSDICLTLDPKDWFDLEQPVVNVIQVTLPASAMVKYREMEKEMFLQLEDGRDVEAFGAAAKTMKCLQLANGAIYLDPERYGKDVAIEVHDEKLDALGDLLSETGDRPLLVAYHFKSDLARLMKRFPGAIDLATEQGMADAKAGKGKLWLGHPAGMGHGVDGLQDHCADVVFFGHWWSLENHDQIIERVGAMRQFQAGKLGPMFIHYLVAKDTVDELVLLRHSTKRETQDLLLEYMKRKGR